MLNKFLSVSFFVWNYTRDEFLLIWNVYMTAGLSSKGLSEMKHTVSPSTSVSSESLPTLASENKTSSDTQGWWIIGGNTTLKSSNPMILYNVPFSLPPECCQWDVTCVLVEEVPELRLPIILVPPKILSGISEAPEKCRWHWEATSLKWRKNLKRS